MTEAPRTTPVVTSSLFAADVTCAKTVASNKSARTPDEINRAPLLPAGVKPYYLDERNGIAIVCGDCREILPTIKADCVVTDPPYGIGRDGQARSTGKHGGRKAYEFLGWDAARPTRETFDAIRAASKKQIIWGGNYFADMLPPSMGWLVWDKGQRINQSDGELAWTSTEQALRICTLNRVELMIDGAQHPTQKPVALLKWCLRFVPDGVILDPYMGVGTTLVAAKLEGRKAIGIEIEERYAEIAAKRLQQEVLPFTESIR